MHFAFMAYDAIMRTALRSLLVQAFLLLYSTEWAVGSTPLYFSLIASFGRDGFNSSGVVPAVDYALEQINSNASSLLPGYALRRTETQDSEVGQTTATHFVIVSCILHNTWVTICCFIMYSALSHT